MKPNTLLRAALTASVMVAIAGAGALFVTDAAAQTRSVPTFTKEAGWPKVPPQMKLGDISSIAIDANDNAWVLHRPRTLKPADAANKAPPVVVFDPNGNYVKSWGGDGPGFEWVEREHGIHI